MAKIVITHYLNTKVKPHIVKGIEHFPVYILIRAKARSTRVRSHLFNELYTKDQFENLKTTLEEVNTIDNLVSTMLLISGEFDPYLFGALFDLLPLYPVNSPRQSTTQSYRVMEANDLLPKHRGKMLDSYFEGPSYYDWFSPAYQAKLNRALKAKKINHRLALPQVNLWVIFNFLDLFNIVSASNRRRYQPVHDNYRNLIDNNEHHAFIAINKALSSRSSE